MLLRANSMTSSVPGPASHWKSLTRPPQAAEVLKSLSNEFCLTEQVDQQSWAHSFELLRFFALLTEGPCLSIKSSSESSRCQSSWVYSTYQLFTRPEELLEGRTNNTLEICPETHFSWSQEETQGIHFELISNCHISVRATQEPVLRFGSLGSP